MEIFLRAINSRTVQRMSAEYGCIQLPSYYTKMSDG